jgi:hypothetical protein
MDEKVPLLLQGDGIIDDYSQIRDGQTTKFKVEVADDHTLADVAREIPDDWQIETNDDGTANIWPPQPSIHVT